MRRLLDFVGNLFESLMYYAFRAVMIGGSIWVVYSVWQEFPK